MRWGSRVLLVLGLLTGCGDDGARGSGETTDGSGGPSTGGVVSTGSGPGGPGATADDTAGSGDSTGSDDTGATMGDGLAWTFEAEALGTSATDVPLAEGGTIAGTLRFVTGQPRDSIGVRGGEGTVVVDDASGVDFGSDAFRLELTARTAFHGTGDAAGRGPIVWRGDEGDRGFAVLVENGRLGWRVWSDGTASEVWSATRFSDDRWHRVSAIRDRDTQELVLVVDGHDVVRAPDDVGDLDGAGPLHLLGNGADERFFGGLDELAIVPGRVDAPEPTPEWDDRGVFTVGADAGYTVFRIPAVVQTEDGTLVAFAEGRVDAECDFGRIRVVAKRSTDGGDTWGPLQVVATSGAGKAGNPIPIADGNRIALMVLETPCETGSGCTCQGAQRHALYLSDDAGQTWTPREEITADVTSAGWGGVLLGPGSGVRLARGPGAGTLVITAKHGTNSHILASEDHGETWFIAAEDVSDPISVNETTAAELSDGRLLVNARYQTSLTNKKADPEAGYRSMGHVATDWSYPDDPTFVRSTSFRGPIVHGALLYHPGSARYGDEARVLFSYPAGQYGTPAGRRHDMRVYVSRDDGETWGRSRRAIGGWAAYSDMVALADGRVGMLYEGGQDLGPNLDSYRRLRFLRARPEWFDHAALATYTFEEVAPGRSPDTLADAGGYALPLQTYGAVSTVEGAHHSTALHFEGGGRACTVMPAGPTRNTFDFGQRDSFAIEVDFRTTAHGSGGAAGSGALVTKTDVGTEPAWWLRVEDGQVRFLMAQCPGEQINCGFLTGACEQLTDCQNAAVAGGDVSDGAWHHVRVVRDAIAQQLVLEIDDEVVATSPATIHGILVNDEPLCVGAFDGGSRALDGDVDHVRIELLD